MEEINMKNQIKALVMIMAVVITLGSLAVTVQATEINGETTKLEESLVKRPDEKEFTWVKHKRGYYFKGQQERGYWKYIEPNETQGKQYEILLPTSINGVELSEYYRINGGVINLKTNTGKHIK